MSYVYSEEKLKRLYDWLAKIEKHLRIEHV